MENNITFLYDGKQNLQNSTELKQIISGINTEYILIYLHLKPIEWGEYGLERMLKIAKDTGAGMVYADNYREKNGKSIPHPLLDYQLGSVRDDFDFGSAFLYKTSVVKQAVSRIDKNLKFAALYDLRLKAFQNSTIIHISEFLYTELEKDIRLSGEKQFDYVDPKNREVQIEMEQVCTNYLKATGVYLEPEFEEVSFLEEFPVEASIVIPVRNREKTIADAIRSALNQETNFTYNVIVIDNHSTDGTTEIIQKIAGENEALIHLIPSRKDLGIGGCWNEAIMDKQCGKFAVQLDSDDLYLDENTLSKIVDAFYKQKTAMIIGSYQMVNFQLESIPPGLIDHKEWTPENGRNNALRINGLGAPRAFYTPVVRNVKFPNVSYGEDYAVGLAISRHYQIGRIYEPLYLCRRWEENSDTDLDVSKLNVYNHYKDSLRTNEMLARKAINSKKPIYND